MSPLITESPEQAWAVLPRPFLRNTDANLREQILGDCRRWQAAQRQPELLDPADGFTAFRAVVQMTPDGAEFLRWQGVIPVCRKLSRIFHPVQHKIYSAQ